MRLAPIALLAIVSSLPVAHAQRDARGILRPITAPVRYAGVYHLGTGAWTRSSSLLALATTGVGIVYDNTCHVGYYAGLTPGATLIDEGRLPSTGSPVLPNAWGLGHDSETGTQDDYRIDGFQIGYCTLDVGPRAYNVNFYEAYVPCSARPATPTAAFALTGLPGAVTPGAQSCWTVDIDLCGSGLSFHMSADADQTYDGTLTQDTFGWSIQRVSAGSPGSDGPLFAGGLPVAGSYQGCSASDGTVFDTAAVSAIYPENSDAINLGCGALVAGSAPEEGSGMGSQNQFRIEGYTGLIDGCYWFDSPPGNFHLQLYSADVELPNTRPMLEFCDPSSGGFVHCPCANPASGPHRGCDNSAGTGGAFLSAAGTAALAADTLVFTSANQVPSSTTILLQGTNDLSVSVNFGQGARCVGGNLKRLYVKSAIAGGISAPGPGDASVSARSSALGDTIAVGSHRYYMAGYRDPIVLGTCTATATFNCTNAGNVLWN